MSGFNQRTVIQSTRKEHQCLGCLKDIPIGSEAINNKGVYDSEWYGYYLHEECEALLKKYSDHFLDGVSEGFVQELVSDFGDEVLEDEAVQKYVLGGAKQ